MSAKIFAVGDIHGCAHELNLLLDKLPLRADSTLVFLGDYIDRGPDSRGVIEKILELREQLNVITLMGNHEEMLLEFLSNPSSSLAGFFVFNGGSATLASYVTQGNHYEIPADHLNFFKTLKLYHQQDQYLFVHAGLPEKPVAQIDGELDSPTLLWIRQPFLSSSFNWGRKVIHGHTPRQQVEIKENRINLDTGCVYGGYLSAMELNSGQIYQVKARTDIPKTFLKEQPQISRVAKRFVGSIPVFIQHQGQLREFETLNYNEFGLLILDQTSESLVFAVGETILGEIKVDVDKIIPFKGEVVRYQTRQDKYAYGVRITDAESK
jgi:serine/threonine protein phosphatase 1